MEMFSCRSRYSLNLKVRRCQSITLEVEAKKFHGGQQRTEAVGDCCHQWFQLTTLTMSGREMSTLYLVYSDDVRLAQLSSPGTLRSFWRIRRFAFSRQTHPMPSRTYRRDAVVVFSPALLHMHIRCGHNTAVWFALWQVCVDPPPRISTLTLSARCRSPGAGDRYLPRAEHLNVAGAIDRRDRQTDGRTDGHRTVT